MGYDVRAVRAVREAARPLGRVFPSAAVMFHEHGAGLEAARAFARRWSLDTDGRIDKNVEFMTHPLWRSYIVVYEIAERLVREWARGDPSRFERLLKEQLRPADLSPG